RVDLFIDVRARRGVRGAEYAFANANRLGASLKASGIAYIHLKDLAPTDAMRQAQYAKDAAGGVGQRSRTRLSEEFVRAYTKARLAKLDVHELVEREMGAANRPALFCVEAEPAACHRSLLGEHLARALGVPVTHLRPRA